jgi:hypothetical protein
MAGTTSEVDEHARRTASLLRDIDDLDREPLRRLKRGRIGRVWTWTSRMLTLAVLVVMGLNAWIAFDVFHEGDETSPTAPDYEDLEVFDAGGRFGGTVTVVNPLDSHIEVNVDVDLYEGDQDVGEMRGSVTMKPDSEATVQLRSFDAFVDHDDEMVYLSGWRK